MAAQGQTVSCLGVKQGRLSTSNCRGEKCFVFQQQKKSGWLTPSPNGKRRSSGVLAIVRIPHTRKVSPGLDSPQDFCNQISVKSW